MASRMKEEEKNEKIIRGLLKLPANRRCINCNSLGPQYVCTNFWTFICTTCSGIHREFTHRVKSISMAKFTSQEVGALQGGGNEHAKEIFFKDWDPQRHYLPDSSNIERLRDFIKHVYVDRRYTGERSTDKPLGVKMGDRVDPADARRADTLRGGSRSPPFEDSYDQRYNDKNYRSGYDERRSPGYEQDYRRSPAKFEVVDDRRFREDRFGNGPQNRRSEDSRFSDEGSRSESRSPNYQKENDMSSLPVVRPVREILGESIPPLRIGEPPKANGGRTTDGSVHTQGTASSSSLGSVEGNPAELKRANSGSLIDFNAESEPAPAAAPSPTDLFSSQPVQQQPAAGPAGGDNWASFGFASHDKAPATSSNSNTLESQLAQLSSPAAGPANQTSAIPLAVGVLQHAPQTASGTFDAISQLAAPVASSGHHMTTMPTGGFDSFGKTVDGSPWSPMHQNQAAVSQFTPPIGTPSNQPWASSLEPSSQGPFATPLGQSSQVATTQVPHSGVDVFPKPQQSEEKTASSGTAPTGRQALPEDLFTARYAPGPMPIQRWQTAPPHALVYGQYPAAMLQSMPTFPQPSKSTNPFDVSSEPSGGHVPSFPSMAPMQGALPRIAAAPTPILHTSSFGTPSQQWVPTQSPSYISAMPHGAYMMQPPQSSVLPLGNQGIGGSFGSEGGAFGALSTGQQPVPGYSQQATPHNYPSSGENPFG